MSRHQITESPVRVSTWALLLSLAVLVAGLAAGGCGDDENSTAGGEPADDEPVKVGMVLKETGNTFFNAVQEGAEAADEASPDIELTISRPQRSIEDPSDQISKIQDVLAQSVDALAVAPVAPEQLRPVLEKATADGVPVVIIDTDLPNLTGKTAYVGTENVGAARAAVEKFIVEPLQGKGKIGYLTSPGAVAVENRITGANEALKSTDIKVVSELATDCVADDSVTATEDMLQANPDLDAIFAACGPAAEGAVQGLKLAGVSPDDIVLLGYDASPPELAALKAGTEDATVAQNPAKMGEMALEAAAAAARGDKVEPVIDTGFELVTKENADEFE